MQNGKNFSASSAHHTHSTTHHWYRHKCMYTMYAYCTHLGRQSQVTVVLDIIVDGHTSRKRVQRQNAETKAQDQVAKGTHFYFFSSTKQEKTRYNPESRIVTSTRWYRQIINAAVKRLIAPLWLPILANTGELDYAHFIVPRGAFPCDARPNTYLEAQRADRPPPPPPPPPRFPTFTRDQWFYVDSFIKVSSRRNGEGESDFVDVDSYLLVAQDKTHFRGQLTTGVNKFCDISSRVTWSEIEREQI